MKTGEWYTFNAGNIIKFPDAEPQLVLISSQGIRYLIPYAPYKDYGIEKGKEIRCKVDKINCTGRIFLEPEHPYYFEGHSYGFEFAGKSTRMNVLGNKEFLWVLKGRAGQEIEILVSPECFHQDPGERVECEVQRIKKGKLQLYHPCALRPADPERKGTWEYLELTDTDVLIENEKCYIFQDSKGGKFLLKMKNYIDFGFKTGQQVLCKFVKWKSNGFWVIEPEHPVYKEGQCYNFTINYVENNSTDNENIIVHVSDYQNNDIIVSVPPSAQKKLVMGQTISLKVSDIRKAKPTLTWPRNIQDQ